MAQEEAIKSVKGPCVILAGAGTGKTHTIVEKIKYIINNKIYKPERIVCITFSYEAANDLLNRVRKTLNSVEEREPIIRTFHGFSADLLREYGEKMGINARFNILTPDDAKVVLHRYLKISSADCHKYISAIGIAKDLGIALDSLQKYLEAKMRGIGDSEFLEKKIGDLDFQLKTLHLKKEKIIKEEITAEIRKLRNLLNLKKFIKAWAAYEKIKQIKNYQDYSDLNKNAINLLQKDKVIADSYDYIIVDEFQDTNKVQLDMLFLLAAHRNITVVGDLNQSIYRFRGAYNRNFSDFKERFKVEEKDFFNLDRSYRSPNKVLRAAYRLILNNYSDLDRCFQVLNRDGRDGENIEAYELKNAREEARNVIELVEREIQKGNELRDICVMFRTHQQGRVFKRAFEARGIPFVSVNKNSLLKEKSIKIVIDYLAILKKLKNQENGGQDVWWNLFYHLDFKEEDLIKIGRFIKSNPENKNLSRSILENLQSLELLESGRILARILVERLNKLLPSASKNVQELIKDVYNVAGMINEQKIKEEKIVMMNLNRFYELAKEHGALYGDDLDGFIYYLNILESLGIEIEAADFEENGVRLMTLHATKGLEYKIVIITNLAQKRFPIEGVKNNPLIPPELSPEFNFNNLSEKDLDYYIYEHERKNQLFEERRLCYVAFTRAKEKLILTYANDYGGRRYYPSPFLHEINYKNNLDFSFFADKEEKYNELETNNNLVQAIPYKDEKNIPSDITFSPSALLLFKECQKKYEYKYVYNMPEQKTISWEAVMLGSFVHKILEAGVNKRFRSLKEYEDLAKEMHIEGDWKDIDLPEALQIIRIFFERNKNKYNLNSKTEQVLRAHLGDFNFVGFADRIDFNPDGIEIVDYKTGKSDVPLLNRSWQLGYYALAASSLGKVRRIVLDVLRHERPLEFELDEMGNAHAINSPKMEGFNVFAVEQELIKTAQAILDAYKKGFQPCAVEKNCEFCNEWVWRL